MTTTDPKLRERVTMLIVAQIFLVFFQAFTVAPLVPRLAVVFGSSVEHVSALVPAYTLPYGCVCLFIGPLADRWGRATMLRWLVAVGVALPALSATAPSLSVLLGWRVLIGCVLGGFAPVALAILAQLYPYAERGRPVGWFFGAIAGGMALGATFGPWLEPSLHWQGLFVVVSLANLVVAIPMWRTLSRLHSPPVERGGPSVVRVYAGLLGTRRGATVYGYIFANGVFHSGVFSWLGVYFTSRYHLSSAQLGLALLGYGIPGFLLGPVVGKLADRLGRRWLIRGGLALAALCALGLGAPLPMLAATATITLLSFGFDLSHPLLAGIVTTLDPVRTAQAMALNTFAIFGGYGVGSIVFGATYATLGMSHALVVFGLAQLGLAAASLVLFDRTWR